MHAMALRQGGYIEGFGISVAEIVSAWVIEVSSFMEAAQDTAGTLHKCLK